MTDSKPLTFRTNDGAEWSVDVTVLTIARCQKETGLRLTDLFSTEAKISEFFADDVQFCLVLAAVVRPQLEAAGKTTDDFLSVMGGEAIEGAVRALLRGIALFFQEPRRSMILRVLEKFEQAEKKVQSESLADAQKQLEEIDFETLIRSQFARTNSASSSRESAA